MALMTGVERTDRSRKTKDIKSKMVKGVAGLSMVGGSGQERIGAKSDREGGKHGGGGAPVADDIGGDE